MIWLNRGPGGWRDYPALFFIINIIDEQHFNTIFFVLCIRKIKLQSQILIKSTFRYYFAVHAGTYIFRNRKKQRQTRPEPGHCIFLAITTAKGESIKTSN
jgi:hypothetical protein